MTTYLVSFDTGFSTRIILVQAASESRAELAAARKTNKPGPFLATPLDSIEVGFTVELGLDDAEGRKALAALIRTAGAAARMGGE